jgi:hypothetical protein
MKEHSKILSRDRHPPHSVGHAPDFDRLPDSPAWHGHLTIKAMRDPPAESKRIANTSQ